MNKEQLVAELTKFDKFMEVPCGPNINREGQLKALESMGYIRYLYFKTKKVGETESGIPNVDLSIELVGLIKQEDEYFMYFDGNEFGERLIELGLITHKQMQERKGFVFSDIVAVE